MAQTVNLALGSTTADSSDIVVAAGSTKTIGIYTSASGGLVFGAQAYLYQKTPSVSNLVTVLDYENPSFTVNGPNTFFVRRSSQQALVPIGVFSE